MNKILVTGGTGFVGKWMSLTQPDLTDVTYLNREQYQSGVWQKDVWDGIVHLAPISPASVIRVANRRNARLLYCSSGAVYERKGEYADNKRKWEHECLRDGRNVVIARLFTFYGDGLDANKAISRYTEEARQGATIIVRCDGNTVRSYMSGEEMGKWMWAILLHGKTGEAYDVGSDKPVTMLELARSINLAHGNKSAILLEFQPQECAYYMPRDVEKTRRLLDA